MVGYDIEDATIFETQFAPPLPPPPPRATTIPSSPHGSAPNTFCFLFLKWAHLPRNGAARGPGPAIIDGPSRRQFQVRSRSEA
eukprot:g73380.t1